MEGEAMTFFGRRTVFSTSIARIRTYLKAVWSVDSNPHSDLFAYGSNSFNATIRNSQGAVLGVPICPCLLLLILI